MKNYSIAIFGSSLRPNFDKYSDKDLLLVSNSYLTLNKLKSKYEEDGYSVSTYTYEKLKYISEKGSLFVQHLKIESEILTDYKGLLSDILKNHKEHQPSLEQIKESLDFFDILKNIPNNRIGFAWFCDCFYIGMRNYMILKSAQNKNYVFSFLNLLNELLKSETIDNDDFEILRQLRVVKKNYRERIYDELPSKEYMDALIKIGHKLNLLPNSYYRSTENFNKIILNYVNAKDTNHYFKLRLVEIFYLLSGQRLKELDIIICNPQLYALKFKNNEFVRNLVEDIKRKTAHNMCLALCRRTETHSSTLVHVASVV